MKKYLIAMLIVSTALLSSCSNNSGNAQSAAASKTPTAATETISEAPNTQQTEESALATEKASAVTQYPVSYEARGKEGAIFEQSISATPKKVITGTPSATEILFELGLGDKIIGTVALDNDPPAQWADQYAALNVLGDKKTVSREIIVGAEPDIVVGRSFTFTEDSFGAIDSLNSMGIPVYTQVASYLDTEQSLENIIVDVRKIGEIFNVQDVAEAYAAEIEARLAAVNEKVGAAKSENPINVVVMTNYADNAFGVFGANASLQSSLLNTVGAANLMEAGGNGLSLENLITANPDAIIYITATRNAVSDANAIDAMLNEQTLQTIPAIANERIIEIPYDAFMDYGTRLFDTMETLAQFFYE